MRRRDFIKVMGGAAVAWPVTARAQQLGRVPRIGYLSPGSVSPGPLAYHDEFQRGLRELGYVEGRNIVIEYRFAKLHVELDGQKVVNVNKKLHGIAFRQSEDHRLIVSNGAPSIEGLVNAITAKWRDDK
jgi:hypothetical protein